MGKAMASFADWVKATNERNLTDPKDILSDAVNRTYTLADTLKGRGHDEVVQSGQLITDRIQLRAGSGFGFYDALDQFSPQIEDVLSKIQCPWRFAKDYWAWTDHEVLLNGGDRLVQWKNLRDSKRQASHISLYNGIEAAIWATPNTSTMESTTTTGGRPYSIRCFITEDGLAPSGFTTVMGVNPSTETKWRNQVSNYVAAAMDATLVSGMEELWRKVKFESPETKDAYFRETKFKKFKIYTSLDGWKNAVRLLRSTNDRNYPTNDLGYATEDPVFGRIPIKWVEALDGVGYATGQPRYFFVNFEYLFPVFHSQRYMWETDPINGGHTQPYAWVIYVDLWYNWFCRSRYRQGILVPT
jgi:hypothetical protein